ncbi:hypothetical protein D3C78_1851680 [compost metagenome]
MDHRIVTGFALLINHVEHDVAHLHLDCRQSRQLVKQMIAELEVQSVRWNPLSVNEHELLPLSIGRVHA